MKETLLNKLDRKYNHFCLHNISTHIIALQVITFILNQFGHIAHEDLILNGSLVLNGEIWRLITFIAIPPSYNVFWAFISWNLFYMFGSTLEWHWSTFKYNVYLFVGFFATSLASLLFPHLFFDSSLFMMTSVMFAFSIFKPDYELRIMLLLPVKIKIISLISAVILILNFFSGDTDTKVMILAGMINFILFFWRDLYKIVLREKRKQSFVKKEKQATNSVFHTCNECGITDKSHPNISFRYCSKCGKGFCEKHISDHSCVSNGNDK